MSSDRKHKVIPFGQPILSGGVGAILAKFWRTITFECGLNDLDRYDYLMQRYIQKTLRDPNRNEKASARAGLGKELMKDSITWKTFIKGLNFMNIKDFKLTITLTHANTRVTEHSIKVVLDEVTEEDKEDRDD